jgi:hypothetical protein
VDAELCDYLFAVMVKAARSNIRDSHAMMRALYPQLYDEDGRWKMADKKRKSESEPLMNRWFMLSDEMTAYIRKLEQLAEQYRTDILYPPSHDARMKRAQWINSVIGSDD